MHRLSRVVAAKSLTIHPVTVASPHYLNWPQEFSGLWEKAFLQTVDAAVEKTLASVRQHFADLPIAAPRVLSAPAHSLKQSAAVLSTFADQQKADLVFLSTHSRRGLEKFFIGSFTETFMQLTRRDLLTVNPQVQSRERLDRVLFPTDLTQDSHDFYLRAVELTRAHSAELILFHRLSPPLEPVREAGIVLTGGGWLSAEQFLVDDERQRRKTAESWLAQAHQLGAKAKVCFSTDARGLSESILAQAEKDDVDLICLDAHAPTPLQAFLGSTTRDIVREATRPVLIMH